ncbi:MAG: sodium/proline symporter [Bacteroidetes bacterium]|nr:sodium/proline symporter [Bacteroidota bacterium]
MLFVFILYLIATMFIAWWYSRGEKTNAEFVLGGKKFSGTALALSERATGESAWLLLGLTGYAYSDGLSAIWVALGCVIGITFIWLVMASRLRRETERSGVMTISSLLSKRFPGAEKPIGMLSAIIVVFFFIFYIAAQFSGSGKVLNKTFGLDPFWGIIIGSFVVTVYCVMGGFIAVVVTDVFQSILMIFTLVAFPIIAIVIASTQNIHIAQIIENADPAYLSFTHGKTGSAAVILVMSGLSWALGYTGQPQLLTRMMAIRNEKEVKTAKKVAVTWTIFAYIGAILIGLFGIAFVKGGPLTAEAPKLLQDAEKILPVMVIALVNPILAGILLSGVISAMMSTASSEVTVSSASITEDIYKNLKKNSPSPKRMLMLNQIVTLAIGIVAIILALTMADTVYGLVSYAWSGIGSSFGPALLLLLFWKKFSRAGMFASLITGTVATVIWKNLFETSTGVSERLASFIIAFVMAVLFSLLIPEKTKA